MASDEKKPGAPARLLHSATVAEAASGRKLKPGMPLTDRITIPPGAPEQLTVHNLPGFVIDTSTDREVSKALFRVGRKAIDDYRSLEAYIARLMNEFQGAARITIYAASQQTAGSPNARLEHKVTVMRGENGEFVFDDSGGRVGDREGAHSERICNVFANRTPTLIDHGLGIELVFSNLDSESEEGNVRPAENNEGAGTLAIMPFYYREHERSTGVAVFEGDLRPRGSTLEGFPRAYWTAHLAMEMAAQVGFQDTHKPDPLTKLPKRLDFEVDVKRGIEQMMRTDCIEGGIERMSLLMIDIDHFKKVNDTYGHSAGDVVLRWVANAIRESVRDSELVCRWGGEEFGVMVKDARSPEDVIAIMERIRERVSQMVVMFRPEEVAAALATLASTLKEKGHSEAEIAERVKKAELGLRNGIRITCCVGGSYFDTDTLFGYLAQMPEIQGASIARSEIYQKVFGVADSALLKAKEGGRNMCMFERPFLS